MLLKSLADHIDESDLSYPSFGGSVGKRQLADDRCAVMKHVQYDVLVLQSLWNHDYVLKYTK